MPNATRTIEFIMQHHALRSDAAQRLRAARAMLRSYRPARSTTTKDLPPVTKEVWYLIAGLTARDTSLRLSRQALLSAANRSLDFGRADFGPITGSDGYAYCGLEDARAIAQDAACRRGYLLRNAARYMR